MGSTRLADSYLTSLETTADFGSLRSATSRRDGCQSRLLLSPSIPRRTRRCLCRVCLLLWTWGQDRHWRAQGSKRKRSQTWKATSGQPLPTDPPRSRTDHQLVNRANLPQYRPRATARWGQATMIGAVVAVALVLVNHL